MRKLWFAASTILAAVVVLTTASVAQTTTPGRNPPQQTTPPAPQIQVPVLTPRVTTAPNPGEPTIPVIIQWQEGRSVTLPPRPPASGLAGPTFPEADHDGDGFPSIARGGTDCDDNNPRIRPSGSEVVDFHGVDEDCNGLTIGVRDRDGDGFTSWQATQLIMSGTTPYAVLRGPDCDDTRRDVNPNAPEVLGDERDNDCDGVIDRIVEPGHRVEYCGPTQRVALRFAADFPCGEARR